MEEGPGSVLSVLSLSYMMRRDLRTMYFSPQGDRPQGVKRVVLAAWRVQRLKQHVDANLSETVRIKDVARVVGLSPSHFCRSFGHHFGFPFGVYLRCRRIEMAQSLMLTTEAPLCEIALSCGMTDQAHFSRVFRKIVGQPPNAWRQSRHDAVKLRLGQRLLRSRP